MKRKSAMMVYPSDLTVSTTAGYRIIFKPNVPKFVPALAVAECLKFGAKETKRFVNTGTSVQKDVGKGGIHGEVQVSQVEPDLDVVEEHFSAEKVTEEVAQANKPESSYTAAENKIRRGIIELITEANPDKFVDTGQPSMKELNAVLDDITASAKQRDRVWDKMVSAGEIPEDWTEQLFGEEEEDSDTEAAA